jgi:hypothetical protein
VGSSGFEIPNLVGMFGMDGVVVNAVTRDLSVEAFPGLASVAAKLTMWSCTVCLCPLFEKATTLLILAFCVLWFIVARSYGA